MENDLTFNGQLLVTGKNKRILSINDLVGGGERINWTNATVVYEATDDIYPPADEVDVTIWDENGNSISDSPYKEQVFEIETITPYITDSDGYTYTINLTGIPTECDKTSVTFTIRIDASNVTFSNPFPNNITWQTNSDVNVGITISDNGGGLVNETTIMRSVSFDNGTTWSNWESISDLDSSSSIDVSDVVQFQDGDDNLVKWCARDSFGNGPVESDRYRVLVDTKNLIFANSYPLESEVSYVNKVEVGIIVSDTTSGVNASTIEYSLSSDGGIAWSDWTDVTGFENRLNIIINLNLSFPNGTENRIKWRASDIAGNGPVESIPYTVNINTWAQRFFPKVRLNSPENGSIFTNTSIELSWILETENIPNVVYDIKLDTSNPPEKIEKLNLTKTKLIITGLEDRKIYYWIVIPKNETNEGFCLSGIWSFSINMSVPVPSVSLVSPANDEIIDKLKPVLQWHLTYSGPELVTYEILIWSEGDFKFVIDDYTTTQYIPDHLDDGVKYFWKVFPKAGNILGTESVIWSFTIQLSEKIPKIGFNLTLTITSVELKPEEYKTIKVEVNNLGDIEDVYSLDLETPIGLGVVAIVDGNNSIKTNSEETAEFLIKILISKEARKGEIKIRVIANSIKAKEYKLNIQENATLTIKIIEDKNESINGKNTNNLWIGIIVLIIIVISLITIFSIFRERKTNGKEESPIVKSLTIKQESLPGLIQTPDKKNQTKPILIISQTTTLEQSGQIVSTPTITQVSEQQQIRQVEQKKQLPSTFNQNIRNEE